MANTANSTAITTNFDVTPYYDDYDPSRGYYRILFKPGYAVQARELTQMQTSLQEQISRFGKNIFKDGTIVLPGQFTLETNEGRAAGRGIEYVKIMDFDASSPNNAVNITEWQNYVNIGRGAGNTRLEIRGVTSNITAQVVQVLDGAQSDSNTKTLYVAYTSASSANATQKHFTAGETLQANVDGTIRTLVVHTSDPAPTGKGSRFSISSGVLFAKNHFVAFPDQSIIIDRYNGNPTARVGFYITEDIVTASQDATLLDPAMEASNFTAPGADRLQLNPVLSAVGIEETTSVQDFVTLFTIENGIVKTYNANTQYSYVNDAMARRTYDNSGDYVVGGLEVQLKEHDNTGSNYGRYETGNNKLLYVGVSPGTAYVSGYQVGMPSTIDLNTDKGLTNTAVSSQSVIAGMGQYVVVNELVGGWELNKGDTVYLYNAAQKKITNKTGTSSSLSGSQIGTAILLSLSHVAGTVGYDATYNLYLADIKMTGSNVFSSVKSVYSPAVGSYASAMCADPVLNTDGQAVLQQVPNSTLLYFTGSNHTDTVRDSSDLSKSRTKFRYNDTQGITSSVTVQSNGVFTLSFTGGTIEELPYGSSILQGVSTEGISVAFNRTTDTASPSNTQMATLISGLVTGNTGNTISATSSHFTRLNAGDKIYISGGSASSIYIIKQIVDDTHVVLDSAPPSVLNKPANTIYRVYQSGDQINLPGIGWTAGAQRTIVTSNTSLQFNLQESFGNTFYATVTYPVSRKTAPEIEKTLRTNRYVKINCANNASGLSGPYDLGVSDVYRIKSIRKGTSTFPSSNTDGLNVTSSFVFDNGQRDTHYDHGTIKPRVLLSSTDRLLVELDYFEPDFTTGAGFFSIDSYPVQDDDTLFNSTTNIRTENIPVFKSPVTGQSYDLRNHLDFRPVKTNASLGSTPAAAPVNPAATSSLVYPGVGTTGASMKFPVPSSSIEYDYYYYLGRIDIVAVDKDNRFQIIKGQPSSNPQVPVVPPGVMALAQLNISPYPSLSPAYAARLGRPELASTAKSLSTYRYTMRDIGILKQRIVNLEYYTSLSLLEKAATGAVIQNDLGQDRFKNGIFTDSFRDNSNAATYDPEFRIVFDPEEKSIRPVYKMDTLTYNYLSGTNVKYNNPALTVDYTETLHYAQRYATFDINVERQSWLYLGYVTMFPSQDIWIDTTIMPDEQLSSNTIQIVQYGTQGTSNEAITAYGTTAAYELNSGNAAYGVYQANGKFLANTTGLVVDVLNSTAWNSWSTHVVGYKVYTGKVTSDGQPFYTQFSTYDAARSYANSINPVGGTGVTVETVYNTERTGTQYWEADSTNIIQTGYKVVDVQNYAYIRPQTIVVHASGMKPYTRMWPYFDSVAMANNARPLTDEQFAWVINNGQYGLPANTVNDLSKTGLKEITITNQGAGYNTNPTITITGDGTGATASPVISAANGKLTQIIVTNPGKNYSYANVTITSLPGRGAGAVATASVWPTNVPAAPVYNGTFANWGDPLVTNAQGIVNFQMRIQSGQFRVGQRNCLVIDSRQYVDVSAVGSPTDVPADVSTGGQAEFIASGQAVTKQRSILSTKTVSYHNEAVSQNYNSAGFEYIAAPPPPCQCSHSCSAYSFLAKAPNGEEGIFLTSVDLFVSRIGTLGFWVEIREMDSGQQITRNTVPYSEVFFNNPANVPISADGRTNACNVKFPVPVFLYHNTQYALVIHPINANPDLYVWTSRLGQTDVNGLGMVVDRRGFGTFYQTNNNTNWDIIPDVDLTVNFYRAEFNTGAATAKIGNRPIEKLFVRNASIDFSNNRGQIFISGDHITMAGATLNSGASVALTDYVVGATSSQNSVVVNTSTTFVAASNTGYFNGEIVKFYSSNGTYKGQQTVSGITQGSGTLDYYINGETSLLHLEGSGGGFVNGDSIICSTDWSQFGNLETIWSIGSFRYSTFHFEPSALNFQLTTMTYSMNTTSFSDYSRSTIDIDPSTTQYFNTEKVVLGRSEEINRLGGANSSIININMQTSSNAVSPLLDLSRTQTIIIDNAINNDTTGETLPTHGSLLNKYISKTVTLAEGQDAEDMQVILSAYRPPGTDVKVWLKILNAQDGTPFAQQNWVELYKDGNGDTLYSSSTDRNNFREFTFLVPKTANDRLTISNTGTTLSAVNVGDTLLGLTSGFTATVDRIENGTIYVMSDYGFAAGETANVSNSTAVYGNTLITHTGRTVALNGTYNGTSNVITYTTDTGVTYSTYKYFAIKVGLLNDGKNSAIVPRVGDLRSIALQK